MDNHHLIFRGETKEEFYAAMKLLFRTQDKSPITATGYIINENKFVLFQYDREEEGMTPFPYPMDYEATATFIWGWLQKVDYPPQPDHDGDNHKGFEVANNSWGEVDGYQYSTFGAIRPNWCMYGK